jgi:hypothetical protein
MLKVPSKNSLRSYFGSIQATIRERQLYASELAHTIVSLAPKWASSGDQFHKNRQMQRVDVIETFGHPGTHSAASQIGSNGMLGTRSAIILCKICQSLLAGQGFRPGVTYT